LPGRHPPDRLPHAALEVSARGLERQAGEPLELARHVGLETVVDLPRALDGTEVLAGEPPREVPFHPVPAVEEGQPHQLLVLERHPDLAERAVVVRHLDHRPPPFVHKYIAA
jgi:hypothetical protein